MGTRLWQMPFIVCLVVLGGCAASSLSTEAETKISRVGVVTLIPDQMIARKIGATVFNNEVASFGAGSSIRQISEELVTTRLKSSKPRWNVVRFDYAADALTAKIRKPTAVMLYATERIKSELTQLASQNNLDAIILIEEHGSENSPGDGLGVVMLTQTLDSIRRAYVHARIKVAIIGRTGEHLALAYGNLSGPEPEKSLDVGALGLQYQLERNLTPQNRQLFAKEAIDLFKTELSQKLAKLKI